MSPNLLYTDIEQDLRASVADLLANRCKPADVLARCETTQPHDLPLWHALGTELGTASLPVPEHWGGQGASLRETAVVLEELGRTVAPVPYLGSAVLATTALLNCPPQQPVTQLLSTLANGETTATLATPLSTPPGAPFPTTVQATPTGLTGTIDSIVDATAADLLIVPALGPTGPELHAVHTTTTGVTIRPVTSLDLTRPIADLELTNATSTTLAGPDTAQSTLDNTLRTAAGLLASEQVGITEWCLTTTITYLKERHQFGRQVGSFQALKHRLADLWQQLVLARAAARYAADTLATADPDAPIAVSVAQSLCATLAVHAAEECVQLHGGIGMTWEHPAHLYLKRAKADEIAFGTPGRHRALLAPLVDLPGPEVP